MRLLYTPAYCERGLDESAQGKLAAYGDLILGSGFNITGIAQPEDIERLHFLDSLSLLDIEEVAAARTLVDLGSGGGLPALVLAVALPDVKVRVIESQRKKCIFIEKAATVLGVVNVEVCCLRAEDYGRTCGREQHDVAVSRAVAALPVVAEYSLPLLRLGGSMVAMRGALSAHGRIEALAALAILGAGELNEVRLNPFEGAENRWAYVARKVRVTPEEYPRRPGVPTKRPLGFRG